MELMFPANIVLSHDIDGYTNWS